MSNFIVALANLLNVLMDIYKWIIIIRVLSSWLNADPFNPIVSFLHRVTDPVLEPIRRILPAMPLDISPMIVIAVIHYFLQPFLVRTLYELASRM